MQRPGHLRKRQRQHRRIDAGIAHAKPTKHQRARDAEACIAKLAGERAKIEAGLADPALYVPGRAAEVTAAQTRMAAIARETETAEAEWLEAAEALEAASA